MKITTKQLIQSCPEWQDYTQHAFVEQLGNGTLDKVSFQHYLLQDYLFLVQFTRAWGLSVYKSQNFEQMRVGQAGINAMLDGEIALHLAYCKEWGLDEQDVKQTPESAATVAYTRYVLDTGMTGDLADLYTALAPCILGYAEIGKNLAPFATDNNPYKAWIDMYSSDEYQAVADDFMKRLDSLMRHCSDTQAQSLQHIFDTATRMEVAFWQMGLDLS